LSVPRPTISEPCWIVSIYSDYVRNAGIEVGAILSILVPEFVDQVQSRRYFSIDAPLIRNEILVGTNSYYDSYESLLDKTFWLHQRIANYILGDNNVYSLDMTCIEIVRSRVDIEKVILPAKTKKMILEQVSGYLNAMAQRDTLKLTANLGYGTGMVCLFYGPSGTGKTMLVHGLAHHFGMQLLMVDMEAAQNNRGLEEAIKYAFKEARLTNSILFFDECDDIFRSDTKESRTLLVEIEKADCLSILATNKTIKLDPALNRRIQLKVGLTVPNTEEREKIWQALIPEQARWSDDVDLRRLATKYHFSGGVIKNVMVAALNMTTQEQVHNNGCVCLTRALIEKVAGIQSEQNRQHDPFGCTYHPRRHIADLCLSNQDKKRLNHLAECEKTGVLDEVGKGILLVGEDINALLVALEAVATESDHFIRAYHLSDLLDSDMRDYLIHPVTHNPVNALDLPFIQLNDHRAITVLIDKENRIAGCADKNAPTHENIDKVLTRLEASPRHIYLVAKGQPSAPRPKGIVRILGIGYPPESLQVQVWHQQLGRLIQKDDVVYQLVERYPMHPSRIEVVCREARIRSIIEHGSDTHMAATIETIILEDQHIQPILFGRGDN
jgi:SpoVK/Ycf46/Vps4 family AAA+-type ATPase